MISSLAFRGLAALSISASAFFSTSVTAPLPGSDSGLKNTSYAAAKVVCKKAGTKAGKTPVSLVVGAKVSCYNIKSAAAGKKLLTKDMTNTCFACHAAGGITPTSIMNTNLRAQSYTLKPASISTAFTAHQDAMAGATLTAKNAKDISNYLQSIK